MKWKDDVRCNYQKSYPGKAHYYYYVWKQRKGVWKAGRFWLAREVDFWAESFTTAKEARAYCEQYDKEKALTIIEEVKA
jgi:hypothetical protein